MKVKAFNKVVDEQSDALYRFILKHLRDEATASDIVQESFERLWNKRNEVNEKKVKSYLFSTAYHLIIDWQRKESKQVNFEENESDTMMTVTFSNNYTGAKEYVEQLLDDLSAQQKAVLLLRDYEGYNYKEIGEITALNESQVKVYIHRARHYLKEKIGKIESII
jgi:RNA polymerase sigma-70 factor (ECF subfamily)